MSPFATADSARLSRGCDYNPIGLLSSRTAVGPAPLAPLLLIPALLLSAMVGTGSAPLPGQEAPSAERIDFNRQIRPILSERCVLCHGPDASKRKGGAKGAGGLRLDTQAGSRADLGGARAIVPGDPQSSELIRRVLASGSERMPPAKHGAALKPDEVALLRRWIEEGGAYEEHWAFRKPQRPALPEVERPAWVRNPIDRFVAARHDATGLRPTPPADRETLIRRLSLDLTGLPPTTQAIEDFVHDASDDAYAKLVKRLLASPAYGEHQARKWLDLARYADSAGYADDPPRVIWAYRDWVIRAFNRNLPFDQFTIEQIAGDLLPEPSDDQLVATAFHRNTMTNNEGGTDDEEFRNVAIVDRVNTTMSTWMGTTMACAQCHDHKYDPLSQKEYFELFAFFNSTEDSDKRDERPRLELFSDAQRREQRRLESELARLREQLAADSSELREGFEAWDGGFPRSARWHRLRLSRSEGSTWELAANLAAITALRGAVDAKRDLTLQRLPPKRMPLRARFVRISLPGKKRILSLAEVEVVSAGRNVARGGTATQSSTDFGGPPARAIDGNTDGDFSKAKSTTHSAISTNPWWEVDLGEALPVETVRIWNRSGGRGLQQRLVPFVLELLDQDHAPVYRRRVEAVPTPSVTIDPSGAQRISIAASFSVARPLRTMILERSAALDGAQVTLQSASKLELEATDDPSFLAYSKLPREILELLVRKPGDRSPREQATLWAQYRKIAPELASTRASLARVQKKLAAVRPTTTVPILSELPRDKRRPTHIHIRGSFKSKGEAVRRGVPAVFPPLASSDEEPDRLALARWLVSPDNPLSARVAVNRIWEGIFGRGLVATSEDFGTRSELPSHPALLDWLATEFLRSGQDIQAMIELIVTSATYRQSSTCDDDLRRRDPDNALLARGSRFRLSAEMIRDQALFVSGLLSPKMFGPPVRPPRPNLGLRAAFGGSTDWKNSTGEDRYRRAIYTQWRRSIPYPSMAVFDAPNRDVCVVRRVPTNTPLQALVTLNDPVYVEAAQALARRVVEHGGTETAERVAFALRTCLGRAGNPAEIARLVKLYKDTEQRYRTHEADAIAMASDPLGPLPVGMDAAALAAWTVVSNVLLNLDEFLVKR